MSCTHTVLTRFSQLLARHVVVAAATATLLSHHVGARNACRCDCTTPVPCCFLVGTPGRCRRNETRPAGPTASCSLSLPGERLVFLAGRYGDRGLFSAFAWVSEAIRTLARRCREMFQLVCVSRFAVFRFCPDFANRICRRLILLYLLWMMHTLLILNLVI